jgi:hypothetical protein
MALSRYLSRAMLPGMASAAPAVPRFLRDPPLGRVFETMPSCGRG